MKKILIQQSKKIIYIVMLFLEVLPILLKTLLPVFVFIISCIYNSNKIDIIPIICIVAIQFILYVCTIIIKKGNNNYDMPVAKKRFTILEGERVNVLPQDMPVAILYLEQLENYIERNGLAKWDTKQNVNDVAKRKQINYDNMKIEKEND